MEIVHRGSEPVDLRLTTQSTLRGSQRRQVREARDRALMIEQARRDVLIARATNIADVGIISAQLASAVSRVAENEAAACPEERHRVDGIADAVALGLLNLVHEAAR